MRLIRKQGIPVIYYVSPQLWAWRPARIKLMKRSVDRVLPIFPFEEAIYRDAGVPVEFVGHPLLDLPISVEPRDPFLRRLSLAPGAPTIALLPGSRPNEVKAILPDGTAKLARFSRLNVSARNCKETLSRIRVFFASEISTFWKAGAVRALRPRFPNPRFCRANACGLNQRAGPGLAG